MLNDLIPNWIPPLQRTDVYTGTLNGAPMLNDLISLWIPSLQCTEVYTGTLNGAPLFYDHRIHFGSHLCNAQKFIQVH